MHPEVRISVAENEYLLHAPISVKRGKVSAETMTFSQPLIFEILRTFARRRSVREAVSTFAPAHRRHVAATIATLISRGVIVRERDAAAAPIPADILVTGGKAFRRIYRTIRPFTMDAPETAYAHHCAVEYVARHKIPGDIVECGVWKGGSVMNSAMTLLRLGESKRKLYVYDPFDFTWNNPKRIDQSIYDTGEARDHEMLTRPQPAIQKDVSLNRVVANIVRVGYPKRKLVPVEGYVEDTIPGVLPKKIAFLRLDTDFYSSTRHELTHLFPRLSRGGVLMIDDYPTEVGATKATDEFFSRLGAPILLHRIHSQGRIAVRTF
jgi:hypothetical protein